MVRHGYGGHQFDLPYMVEQWDDTDTHVEEPIAILGWTVDNAYCLRPKSAAPTSDGLLEHRA